ncbi:transcription factor HRS1-like [Forsythia ovata]|uniref:Transcription factor HRS1-like n=1 Tax=Forsythia ovata TaxID=205694 RepID=A0ABD1VJK2_9LAMI
MGSIPPQLNLNCTPTNSTYIPKTICEFLAEVSMIANDSDRLIKLDNYINGLQEEMKKIDAFKRELPLCMLLLNDAIVTMEEESTQYRESTSQPVLEEFIPLKKTSDDHDHDDQNVGVSYGNDNNCREKMNWMSSAQLWNADYHHNLPNIGFNNNKQASKDLKKRVEEENNSPVIDELFQSERAFLPSKGCTNFPTMTVRKGDKDEIAGVSGLSLCTPGIKNSREDTGCSGLKLKSSYSRLGFSSATNGKKKNLREDTGCSGLKLKSSCSRLGFSSATNDLMKKSREDTGCSGLKLKSTRSRSGFTSATNDQSNLRIGQQQTSRKLRRSWSPGLHHQFVNALQQLGGARAATPKQIRERMQVDGLTNDEVKSHLQKYRIHTRRVPTNPSTSTNEPVVLLGSLWTSQVQYGDSSKQSDTHSVSSQSPLQLASSSRCTSMTEGDSMENEDDEK